MITIATAAALEIKRLQKTRSLTSSRFRITIETGGCMGSIYSLEIEEAKAIKPGDRLFEMNDISLVIDDLSYPHLRDLKLDYAEDLMGGGFRFDNPHVSSVCSCGQSFKIEKT
ncbi:MAG: HesB/IscA family protein [Prochloraceae cyanobacterium]